MMYACIDIPIPHHTGECNITPLSDLHLDSLACDHKALNRLIAERAALPNSHFISMGDLVCAILPTDKRYRHGVQRLPDVGDVIQAEVNEQFRRFKDLSWLGFLSGNHESTVAIKHYQHPTKMLAQKFTDAGLKGAYLGYSAYLVLRLTQVVAGNRKLTRGTVRFLLHHGAWCGAGDAGFLGAMRWAAGYDNWDVLLYGHNHQTAVRQQDIVHYSERGVPRTRTRYICACGTFMNNTAPQETTWLEQKGHAPVRIGAPLITIAASATGPRVSVQLS